MVNGLRSIEFGNPGESRANLISMILDGNKRATAGTLEWDYQAENEPIETIGEDLAILDNDGSHVGTIRATRVEVVRFADVPDEFALAEAEGDLLLLVVPRSARYPGGGSADGRDAQESLQASSDQGPSG